MGVSTEHALIYHLLAEPWNLIGAGTYNVLQADPPKRFRYQLEHFFDDKKTIDPRMADYSSSREKRPSLKNHFFALCETITGPMPRSTGDLQQRSRSGR